jgi:predicted nucleotidyltransferase
MDTIPLLPDFLDLLRFLNEERVEYLVIGGMAVNYYGYHRSTGDLDVWVAISPENQERLATALKKFGFSAQSVARRPLLEERKFIRIGEQPVRVEIHGGISGVDFNDCYPRAEVCSVQGIDVPVIGLQDLRKNKLAAGRTKDQADLEALPDDTGSDR